MKIKILLFSVVVATSFQVNAQTWVADSISMGGQVNPPPAPTYYKDVYYSFKNGTVKTDTNLNWHLAFGMIPQSGASAKAPIIANHVQGKVNAYSIHAGASKFGVLVPSDTTGKTLLLNSDTSWGIGAFNRNADVANPFDYGWGKYDMSSHFIDGDSLYLVEVGSSMYQILFQQYKSTPTDSIQYIIRVANFDNSNSRTIRVYRKNGFTDRNFAYYNIATDAITDREPGRNAWDIVFTRYKETITQSSVTQPYSVTTVLSNYGVTVAEVNDLNPPTTGYATKPYLTAINIIGSDWKIAPPPGPPPPSWTLRDSAYYFIKTKNTNEYYELHFTRFDGASTGMAVFEKRKLGDVLTVNNVKTTITAFAIVPNPAMNETSVMIDAKENGNAMILISDITGKLVERSNISLNKGVNGYRINTSNYVSGTYVVAVSNGDWKINEKLVVQH